MQRQWTKLAEMIHTVRQIIRSEFTAPTHWQQRPILVSILAQLLFSSKSKFNIIQRSIAIIIHSFPLLLMQLIQRMMLPPNHQHCQCRIKISQNRTLLGSWLRRPVPI